MIWLYILGNAAFLLWVIFLGGARVIEGSWLAAWEFHALASEGQIKFLAWVWLAILAIFSIQQLL